MPVHAANVSYKEENIKECGSESHTEGNINTQDFLWFSGNILDIKNYFMAGGIV